MQDPREKTTPRPPVSAALFEAELSETDRAAWEAITREAKPLHRTSKRAAARQAALISEAHNEKNEARQIRAPRAGQASAPPPKPKRQSFRQTLAPKGSADSLPMRPAVSIQILTAPEALLPSIKPTRREKRAAARGPAPKHRLDLHGYTEEGAHAALIAFVEDCAAQNVRLALIITGKGRTRLEEKGAGILRRNLPRWLSETRLSRHVLALLPAAPAHGGEGAFYLTLRGRKPKA